MDNQLNPHVLAINIGSPSATVTIPAGLLPKKSQILGAYIQNGAGIAQDDTNYSVFQLFSGATLIASSSQKLTGGDAPLVANVPLAMNIQSGQDIQAAMSALKLTFTKNGTAVPTNAQLLIYYYPL